MVLYPNLSLSRLVYGRVEDFHLFCSPVTYIYIVIEKTISHGEGCHVGVHNMSIFMYADDLVLLSPSVCHLQRMINVVADEIADLDMAVNTDKSYCVSFGKRHNNEKICLTLNGTDLVWKKELKYLGILFVASKK